MSKRTESLQEVLSSSFQNQMSGVHTAIPCIVVAIRGGLNGAMVDIQPTINQRFRDNEVKSRPVILGVPVSFPVSATAGLSFPISVGTTGVAIFSMRNLDAWKNSNGLPSTPLNFAKFDKGDAIFIPGIQPPSVNVNNPDKRLWQHSTQDTVLVNNIGSSEEVEIRLKSSGEVIVNTNQDVRVNCNNASVTAIGGISLTSNTLSITASTAVVDIGKTTWVGNITMNGALSQSGNYTGTGTMTFNGVNFSSHVHGTSPGPSNP